MILTETQRQRIQGYIHFTAKDGREPVSLKIKREKMGLGVHLHFALCMGLKHYAARMML